MKGPAAIAFAMVLLAGPGGCVSAAGAGPRAGSRDEAAILQAFQASAGAWNEGDLAGHLSIYADDVTFMTGSGPVRGVAAIEQAFRESYWRDGRPVQTLSFEQVDVSMLDTDSALVTGRFILSGGGDPEQTGWFSLVWVRTGEGWRVVHDHSS